MGQRSEEAGVLWYDDDAGPVVRPYTVTRGRTHPQLHDAQVDVIALVTVPDGGAATDHASGGGAQPGFAAEALDEEHVGLLERCSHGPQSVAELAVMADLPLGVVRVLVGDLLESGRLRIIQPIAPAELPDVALLRHVISGLRAL